MTQKRLAILAVAAGVICLLSTWGRVSDWTEAVLHQDKRVRPEKVVYWTTSGSPEVDLKRARQFEQLYPDVNIEPNFRESGGIQDILFISFLSGNPPDYMDAERHELRKYVLIGGIHPLDDLLAAENARLAAEGQDYFDQYLIGKARIHRFNVNPDDRFIREMERYPMEAARLLQMDGRAIGLRDVALPQTLTYNKRLFREAAKVFPEAGLVDEHGEPVPPTTWLELYETARVITEYGRRAAKERGLDQPVCYGMVIQGQRARDIVRGIKPLARRAGSVGFDFGGDTRRVHQHLTGPESEAYADKPIGFFEYEGDAYVAAFSLLLRLKRDGVVLPGTEARHYEDVRTALASGEGAMVIDGWHAAAIGCERVPWAAQDLGSAAIPLPYHAVDEAAGWTRQKVEAERRSLHELLALDEVGIALPPGNKLPLLNEDKIEFFTSLCRSPGATWEWRHFGSRYESIMKAECRRGMIRLQRQAVAHLGDPEWFPYPFQPQVYAIMENDCAMWPEPPPKAAVRVPTEQDVFYKYFYQTEIADLAEILRKAREEVKVYSDVLNESLARRIQDGIVRPGEWTFANWAPNRAAEFSERQQNLSAEEGVGEALAKARQRLVALAKAHPEWDVLDETGDLRSDLWRFEPPEKVWQVVWVPVLMLGLLLAWFVWVAVRGLLPKRPSLGRTLLEARRGVYGYAFVFPGMLALFAFAIYPSLYQFYLALHTGDGLGPMQWAGAENFARIFGVGSVECDHVFWLKVVPNTLLYMAVVTAGRIALGLFIASLLNLPLRANKVYRVLFFIPLATSLAVVSVILIGLLRGEDSGLNQFLGSVGLGNLPYWLGLVPEQGRSIDWLGQKTGLWTIMGVGIWHGLPYTIILLLAGLQSISPSLY